MVAVTKAAMSLLIWNKKASVAFFAPAALFRPSQHQPARKKRCHWTQWMQKETMRHWQPHQ
jgi:hypothetical protein